MLLASDWLKIRILSSQPADLSSRFFKDRKVWTFFKALRAPDCKYQKSYDRREISDFILFHLNVPFGELFSKNTIKSSAALSFFEKLEKLDLRLHARLIPLGKWENRASLPSSHFAMETIPVILPRLQVNLSIISR